MPKLEPTFETLVDTFVFLDENKDGYVSREEMVRAIDESGERSSGRIAMKRFGIVVVFLCIYINISNHLKLSPSLYHQDTSTLIHVLQRKWTGTRTEW